MNSRRACKSLMQRYLRFTSMAVFPLDDDRRLSRSQGTVFGSYARRVETTLSGKNATEAFAATR